MPHVSHTHSGHGPKALPTLRLVSTPSSESPATDEQLFREFRAHDDRSAFDAIMHRYDAELHEFLRRYLGNAESADDVFQATFLKIYVNRLRFEDGRSFRPWLYTVAKNQAIDSQRRGQARRTVSLDQQFEPDDDSGSLGGLLSATVDSAADVAEQHESETRVREAIEGLSPPLKETLLLVYFHGMKYDQAAGVMKIPVGTVKSRLRSAILKLAGVLGRNAAVGVQPATRSLRPAWRPSRRASVWRRC
ncbi:MAG: RNA polymerase sigma factor [Planctomycetia bacterium]|jgi:RNA polymerase sigma-70 factor (ECF subfamily)